MLPELMYHAQIIYGQNTNYIIPMFVALAVMYFIVCYALSLFSRYLEKELHHKIIQIGRVTSFKVTRPIF